MDDDEYEKLSKEKSETFHKILENILFATKRATLGTGTDISCLTNRSREPDQSNWLNMVKVFKYVRGTKDLTLILSADKSGILKWYIYGSYDVKPNMRGNTGRGIKMGKLFTILASSNKKLNTRRSKKWEQLEWTN